MNGKDYFGIKKIKAQKKTGTNKKKPFSMALKKV